MSTDTAPEQDIVEREGWLVQKEYEAVWKENQSGYGVLWRDDHTMTILVFTGTTLSNVRYPPLPDSEEGGDFSKWLGQLDRLHQIIHQIKSGQIQKPPEKP